MKLILNLAKEIKRSLIVAWKFYYGMQCTDYIVCSKLRESGANEKLRSPVFAVRLWVFDGLSSRIYLSNIRDKVNDHFSRLWLCFFIYRQRIAAKYEYSMQICIFGLTIGLKVV